MRTSTTALDHDTLRIILFHAMNLTKAWTSIETRDAKKEKQREVYLFSRERMCFVAGDTVSSRIVDTPRSNGKRASRSATTQGSRKQKAARRMSHAVFHNPKAARFFHVRHTAYAFPALTRKHSQEPVERNTDDALYVC